MEVNFIERKFNVKEKSIEKLFDQLQLQYVHKRIQFNVTKNPYVFSFLNVMKGIFYFRKNQKKTGINHIVGDIHWAAILLDPKRTIITVHDLVGLQNYRFFKKIIYSIFWIYLPFMRVRYIIAISEKTKREILSVFPFIKKKVKVIPNCVTIDIEEQTELKKNIVVEVLIVGTRSNKNIERYPKALKGLKLHVTVIGPLSEEQIYLFNYFEIDFVNRKFIEEQELNSFYKKADILLFASLYEGFGLPILEAQAKNVLVITSNFSPMLDVCGRSAILVNPYSIDSIRLGVIKALEMGRQERLELLHKGKCNVAKYLPIHIAEAYLKVYNSI